MVGETRRREPLMRHARRSREGRAVACALAAAVLLGLPGSAPAQSLGTLEGTVRNAAPDGGCPVWIST
jgi:hypothetical protein